MRLRAVQFACLMLLLSALGASEATAQPCGRTLATAHMSLLAATHARLAAESPLNGAPLRRIASRTLPTASRSENKRTWPMRPASAHTATLHAVTGSSL